ncbi:MAG: iron-containing redox enzyme family protein [Acidimicrobiales bacterium]|nr:iron-containing redox enzyme family protein [Acidimicrobiales bacterium]
MSHPIAAVASQRAQLSGGDRLPAAVGPVSGLVRSILTGTSGGPAPLGPMLPDDPFDADAQLAWFTLNSLHYGGWDGVADELEWSPRVVAARRALEAWFVEATADAVEALPADPHDAVRHVLAGGNDSHQPGVASYLADRGTAADVAESLVLRFPYQRIEADPHTFVLPRLTGTAKRALCEVQTGEYGVGHRCSHAELYLEALRSSGAPTEAEAIWPQLPGIAYATCNLISLGSLNRARRGLVLGQLALFEMDSVGPNTKLVAACDRLGLPAGVRRFFHVHVLADAEHERIVEAAFLRDYPREDPGQLDNIRFGIAVQALIDRRLAAHAVGRWSVGRSALTGPTVGRCAA